MSKSLTKNFTFRVDTATSNMIDEIQKLTDSTSKNSAIDSAIKFYYGYLTSSISQDYLCGVLGTKLEATQRRNTDHIARLLYKQTVEMNTLIRLIAGDKSLSKDNYEKIRRKAINEVNSVRGIINVYEASFDDILKGDDKDKKGKNL